MLRKDVDTAFILDEPDFNLARQPRLSALNRHIDLCLTFRLNPGFLRHDGATGWTTSRRRQHELILAVLVVERLPGSNRTGRELGMDILRF
jgi:hypothetical protein